MNEKVLIIGVDAMDPRIIKSLDLPNLKSLSTFSPLQTTMPPETPVAWSAASTGVNPGKYGIFDFIGRDPQTYTPKLNLAHEKRGILKVDYTCAVQGTPFWRTLSKNNLTSTILRWPVTFPAESIKGKMLSGLGVVDIKGMLNKYAFYTDQDVDPSEEGSEKVIHIQKENNTINTHINGPLIKKDGALKDVQTPLTITIENDTVHLQLKDQTITVKEQSWSDHFRIPFKVYFTSVSGIANVFLESIEPFKMYMSSVQIDPQQQIFNITSPKEYGAELENSIGLFHTLGMPEDTKAVTENRLPLKNFVQQIHQIEKERTAMFNHEFKQKNDVLACVFDAGDRLKHIFWDNTQPTDELAIEHLAQEIKDYYYQKDALIEQVLSQMSEQTKLIVLSDHGFSTFRRQVNINNWLVDQGFMKAKEADLLFQGVQWQDTKAYALGFTSLYVNQQGREGKGCVSSSEKEGTIQDIKAKLLQLKDGSAPVFSNVYEGSKIYVGPHTDHAPDLILGFNPGFRMSWRSVSGGFDKEVIQDNTDKWKGDHLIDNIHVPGSLLTNFPITKKDPEIFDIAPTVLKFCDIPLSSELDGTPLQ